MFDDVIDCIRSRYGTDGFIALHEPIFFGNEKAYLCECIDSTFVSSVGAFVERFEAMVAEYTGAKHAVATVNGTAALHLALLVTGVKQGDEVITQPLSFVATCNAISYCGAEPVFVDVERATMGLSPEALEAFLHGHAELRDGACYNKGSGRRIAAVVPMHTFGHPCRIDEIAAICERWNIALVEDAAESLGSFYKGRHTGTFGTFGTLSFNGNKTITAGGGGMILTDDDRLAARAKHLSTTAKEPHPYAYVHDEVGYNYRLPNINAALGCAQMESLEAILKKKRALASDYAACFGDTPWQFVGEPDGAVSNYWLNALLLKDEAQRDAFLEATNRAGVMTRPVWQLLHRSPMYAHVQRAPLDEALWLEARLVNIPSGVRP